MRPSGRTRDRTRSMNDTSRAFIGILTGVLTGVLTLASAGCSPAGSRILGQMPGPDPVEIRSVQTNPGSGPLTVSGVMIEKCPEAGCWFVLRDHTGTLKVDTKTAGFVVVDIPLNRRLTVVGQVITNGTQVLLAATGIRY